MVDRGSPLMLEVDADDLEAVYATLDEHKTALQAAEEEISELSSALVVMERDRDRALAELNHSGRLQVLSVAPHNLV